MAKILITGASGFVGSWMVKESLSRGLDTYAGLRKTSSRSLLSDEKINFCEIDFDDKASLQRLLEIHQFDYIIHNAGVTRAQKDSLYFKVNSEYSCQLAELSRDILGKQLKKFVFISSIEAYGSADNTVKGVVDHDTVPNPRTTYGKSKLRAEKGLLKIKDLPLLILRPTAVFGPAEKDFLTVWKTIKRYRFAPVIGDADIKYSFVYVKDLVRATIDIAISEHTNKAYFVSDGRIYKISDFTSSIAKSLDVNAYGFTIPFTVLEGIVGVNKIYDRLTGYKSILNEEQLAKMRARNWDCDISDLVSDLGYQANYNLHEAIQETTEWYLKQGWL